MIASSISLNNAKSNKLFYFVATAVVWRKQDGRCLILKRAEREIVHSGLWGVIGGKLEWKNLDLQKPTRLNGDVLDFEHAAEGLLAREAKEEASILIESKLYYLGSVAFVRPDGIPAILTKFAVKQKSGEVILNPHDFTDFAWVNGEEVKQYQTISGIPQEVALTIDFFNSLSNKLS